MCFGSVLASKWNVVSISVRRPLWESWLRFSIHFDRECRTSYEKHHQRRYRIYSMDWVRFFCLYKPFVKWCYFTDITKILYLVGSLLSPSLLEPFSPRDPQSPIWEIKGRLICQCHYRALLSIVVLAPDLSLSLTNFYPCYYDLMGFLAHSLWAQFKWG